MKKRKSMLAACLVAISLLLSSCSLPGLPSGNDKNTISIGTLATSESQILSGIVKGMIEHNTDLKVNLVNNLGTSTILHQAMLNGDVSLSASRYTGTDLSGALGLPAEKDADKAFQIVKDEFLRRYDQKWYPSYGFANSYAFMVSKKTAEKYNLKTVSDMKEVADQLTAGVDTSWLKREGDGYKAFTEDYGFDFKKVFPMDVGLVYDAVSVEKMDVVLGYSTDGRIASYDLVVLEDDRKFFPPYDCSIVVGNELLEQIPELDSILSKLSGKIDTATMQQLNYEVDDNLLEAEIVAKRFLQKNDYFDERQEDE